MKIEFTDVMIIACLMIIGAYAYSVFLLFSEATKTTARSLSTRFATQG